MGLAREQGQVVLDLEGHCEDFGSNSERAPVWPL